VTAAPAQRRGVVGFLTMADHKTIGLAYLVTACVFFAVAGAMAGAMRAELAQPGMQVVSAETYDQLFTVHGTLMMLLFAGPFAFGLANYLVPLQVGAPDMAFPRLNALSYWLFVSGGVVILLGFGSRGGAADFGWFGYTPLSEAVHSPQAGADLWIAGLLLTGVSGVLTAVNVVVTTLALRAPGMTMFRLPIFTWNMLVTSLLVLLAFPVVTAALLMLWGDRHLGMHVFDPNGGGGPLLWQHLFWFFGHPEVYVIALPFFGVFTEIIPVFSRKPVFGYHGLVFATFGIAAYSVGVWAHHMFATGAVLLPFFSALSFLIAVPTGVKFFNWIATMWRGSLSFETPMLFVLGGLLTFLIGGLSGVMVASPPIDFQVHDTYFVVAHMHYVLNGTAVYGAFAAVYFWFPKFTGRRLSESLGRLHFLLQFVGFMLTFWGMHLLGLRGMPRRVADYSREFTGLNQLATVGYVVLAIGTLVFLWNVVRALRRPADPLMPDDPWGYGGSLEWATSSPPPHGNFALLPRIRSPRPAWDLHHPPPEAAP
jgi:cytochrome c oxidase subunit 1